MTVPGEVTVPEVPGADQCRLGDCGVGGAVSYGHIDAAGCIGVVGFIDAAGCIRVVGFNDVAGWKKVVGHCHKLSARTPLDGNRGRLLCRMHIMS